MLQVRTRLLDTTLRLPGRGQRRVTTTSRHPADLVRQGAHALTFVPAHRREHAMDTTRLVAPCEHLSGASTGAALCLRRSGLGTDQPRPAPSGWLASCQCPLP